MSYLTRPHMTAIIEEMESHRAVYQRALKSLDEGGRGDQPECWQAAEDCANGFRTPDELLVRHEGE